MMSLQLTDTVVLCDGNQIPALGLGCYKVSTQEIDAAVSVALRAGYRHFDTAAFYENEEGVGAAVRHSSVPREEIFVTTKLWPGNFSAPEEAIEQSLHRLNLGYVDAFLLHWPGVDENARLRAWQAMLRYRERGLIRSVGVSNFLEHHLISLATHTGAAPALNQVELHPWYQQRSLQRYCKEQHIALTAWGPIFRGHISEVPLLHELSQKYGRSPAQITLRWHLQSGLLAIPKSVHKERIEENCRLYDFSLCAKDMASLDALDCGRHFSHDPNTFDGRL